MGRIPDRGNAARPSQRAENQRETKRDLVDYQKQWAALAGQRQQVKALLKKAAGYRVQKRMAEVGDLLEGQVVPGLSRLVARLQGFNIKTRIVRKTHNPVVAAYRRMLEAYRLAGRAWKKSGRGLGAALAKLRQARLDLRSSRSAMNALARRYGVVLE